MTAVEVLDADVVAVMRRRASDPEVQGRLADILDRPKDRLKDAADETRLAPPRPSRPRRRTANAAP